MKNLIICILLVALLGSFLIETGTASVQKQTEQKFYFSTGRYGWAKIMIDRETGCEYIHYSQGSGRTSTATMVPRYDRSGTKVKCRGR